MAPREILRSRLPREAAFRPPNDRPFFPGNNPRGEAARSRGIDRRAPSRQRFPTVDRLTTDHRSCATLIATVTPEKNKLYYGDNYEVLQRYVKDESVDLVYLDPPFNSRQDYNDMMAYLAMMVPRLVELRRVLKETGSIGRERPIR
jgi:16S rRNA G966 N2-methylase RsmD